MCAIMLPIASLLFVGSNQTVDVYAASINDLRHSNGTGFNAENINWADYDDTKTTTINLYDSGSQTLDHYNISVESGSGATSASRSFDGSKLYLSFGGTIVWKSVDYNVETFVTLPSYMVGNSNFNIKLIYSSSTATAQLNGSENLEINGSSLTSNNLKINFTQTNSSSSAVNPAVFEVNAPQVVLTSTDKKSPKINFGNDIQIDGGRTINFSVVDDGVGIKYVKFAGNTYNNVSDNTQFSFDAMYNSDYTIEVSDNVGNITYETIHKDNTCPKTPIIRDLKSAIHDSQVTFTVGHDRDITPHSSPEYLYYTIVSLTDYKSGNYTLDNTCNTLNSGSNTITLGNMNIGTYKILVVAIDGAGNRSTDIANAEFEYDTTMYTLTLPQLVGGKYTSVKIGEEEYYEEGKTNYNVYYKDSITLSYEALDGYKFYDIVVDDRYLNLSSDIYKYSYSLDYSKQNSIEIKFRYIVCASFDTEYTFDSTDNNLINQLNNSLSVKGLDDTVLDNGTIEYYLYNSSDVLLAQFTNCTLNILDKFYNVGNYYITWNISEDNNSNYVVDSSSRISLTINPKVISNISYSNLENLIYNANNQNISFDLANANLSENEIEYLKTQIKITYYLTNDTEYINPLDYMLNAGEYLAKVSVLDNNYIVDNDTISNITISKKNITIVVSETILKYNESNRNIDFTISDSNVPNDALSISYQILSGEEYVDSDFRVVGTYKYLLSLDDEYGINYTITNVSGECQIIPSDVYFQVNKLVYDYTGSIIKLDYSVYDSQDDNRQLINSINNVFDYMVFGGTELQEVGTYSIQFTTSDNNYILHNIDWNNIEINQTIITINVTTEYEYNGASQNFIYEFVNEDGEILVDIVGIDVVLQDGNNNQIDSFVNVGTYSYTFNVNPKFVIVGSTTGEFNVVPAIINVEIIDTYEYLPNDNNVDNIDYYNVSYNLISTKGNDFKSLNFVSFEIKRSDENLSWGDVGEYLYTFTSLDSNITFEVADGVSNVYTGTINITPRNINVIITNEYTYTSEDIAFKYTIDNYYGMNAEDIIVNIDSMRNAKKYIYSITSNNPNYTLVLCNANIVDGNYYVEVLPARVNIATINQEYMYTGLDIDIELELASPFDEVIEYTINRRLNGELIESIINAGTYSIDINSSNSNYIVVYDYIQIVVLPKTLSITVEENATAIYNGKKQNISYIISDLVGNEMDVRASVKYSLNLENVEPINVGTYNYTISLADGNYILPKTTGTLKILQREINIVAKSGQSKIYGSADSAIEYDIEGLVDGDSAVVTLIREEGEDVGVYYIKYIEGSLDNNNYLVNFRNNTYVYEIVAKKLVVIADKQIKQFGDIDAPLTYKMYIGGEMVTELLFEDTLSGTLSRVAGEDVGTYNIELGTLSNSNYHITFVKNVLTITPRDLHIAINNISVEYGVEEELTFTASEEYNNEYIFGTLAREEGDSVGAYAITQGNLSSINYNLIITNGTYTITPKDVFVSAIKCSKVYGDSETLEYTVTGLLAGDSLQGSLTRELGEDVGTYNILVGSLHNDNYNIIFASSVLSIQKTKLSIIFDDKTQVYGEKPAELTYQVIGLKNDDRIDIKLFRESGENVGVYQITGAFNIPSNYIIDSFTPGKYTIEKARVVPVISSKKVIYNGKPQTLIADNFDYELQFVYKLNGFKVDECVNAGTYSVYAEFAGNNNYYPAKSKEATLIIEKQLVFISVTTSEFIYDGTIKYPEFSYDKNIGIDENSFTFKFENDVFPMEEGSYNFAIIISDVNFEGQTQGVVKIQKPLSITNDNSSILECEEATFDEQFCNVKLVQNSETKKFNNERVLSVCSLENVGDNASGYIYTVKVKATAGVDNVKVYKVGLSGFSQQAIKIEDGYYVFKIDDPNDKYIITTEIKTLSTLAWILILVAVVLVFGSALIIVSRKKHKKVKATKADSKNIETYNVN